MGIVEGACALSGAVLSCYQRSSTSASPGLAWWFGFGFREISVLIQLAYSKMKLGYSWLQERVGGLVVDVSGDATRSKLAPGPRRLAIQKFSYHNKSSVEAISMYFESKN